MFGELLATYILPLVLALIMLGMGLSLTFNDFKRIIRYPKSMLVGLGLQMIGLPFLAFLLAWVAPFSPAIKVGIVLVAACPGGTVSNLITYLLQGNLALSILLTSFNSLLTIFTIPSIVNLALWVFMGDRRELSLPFWNTFVQILLITVIPAVLGIYVRHRVGKRRVEQWQRWLKYLLPGLLGIAMVLTIYFNQDNSLSFRWYDYLGILPFMLGLNLGGMLLGYYVSKAVHLKRKNCLTIAIEVGLQNTGLAITVATSATMLNSPEAAIPASVYALFTFFTAVGLGLFFRERLPRKDSGE
ncbi:MAG: transporter [Thermonema sp.]|uniref:bile acid:sodium symporter family protein n=1 Tax=Thermonema TaxID=28194 RepID=UPI00056EF555|nr:MULTISPECIES: bile acid:sodium symporter family protein [Thermonema]GIV40433.1 MAG: transporter [Thermonema sp.]